MSAPEHSFEPSQLTAYAGTGFELIRLHSPDALDRHGRGIGKTPCQFGWRIAPAMSIDDALAHRIGGGNVGARLRADQLVVDVDPRNGGDVSLRALIVALDNDLGDYPTVITGGGGQHIYMRKPADLLVVTTLDAYSGVEFKTLGTQVVAPGSIHPETKRSYGWDPLAPSIADVKEAPATLLALIERKAPLYQSGEGGKRTPDDLAELLAPLDPCGFRDHDRWFEMMAASHHATSGMGRQEFIDWSTGDPAYRDHGDGIGRRWDSLAVNREGRAIKEATLFKALSDAGQGDVVNRVTARGDFDGVEEEPDGVSDDARPQNGHLDIAERFVWVAEAEVFVRRADTKRFPAQQFKSLHAGAWKEGDILNAIWRDKLPMRKFESMVYLPWEGEVVANAYGGQSYNLWRDSSIEPKAGNVDVFLEHMAYLFPDEAERDHALDYLALLVSRPAVKINFAMLVRGVQGTGKSWLGSLTAKMIGESNVTRPTNSVVVEKYTDWQLGAQFAIIEELMAMGRLDVANRLKPAITDDYLSIRPMFGRAYTVPNRLNFMCFTNHDDALPIEQGDRRWLVMFSPAVPASEAYYDKLFRFLDGDGPAHVVHWLGQRDVKLNPKGVAPMTRGKAEMRGLSMGEAEQYLSDLLAAKAPPFDFGLVRLDDVLGAVPERAARQAKNLRNRVVKWLRDEVGAVTHDRYTKGDRPAFQLWSIDGHEHWAGIGAAGRVDAYVERYPKI
jgi:hypothetical protein